jgi:NADH-quinone oxidoreductase subunit N
MTSLLSALAPFQELAPTAGDWRAILPEIVVAALGLFALLQALVLPAGGRWLIPTVARVGLVLAIVLTWSEPISATYRNGEVVLPFAGLIAQGEALPYWRLLFLGCALLTSLIASRFIRQHAGDDAEYHHVLLLVTASLMVLAQSSHVVTFFVALETATVGLYILVGFLRKSTASLEAGVKYLVAGGLSSALLLMGFVLLYGFAGMSRQADPLSFAGIGAAIALDPANPLMLTGAALVLCGVAFKLGSFPFHGWIPDVYQGAPTPTTALLATSSKAAGVVALILLIDGPFAAIQPKVSSVLAVLAAGSLLAGNLGALGSTQTKRALALSGVSHAGFLLAAISTGTYALGISLVYLAAYAIATFATLGALAAIPAESDDRRPLLGLRGLIRRSGSLTASLTLGIGSLAGIPPSIGFMTKLLVLIALVNAKSWGLLAVSVASVAVSIHYYFSIIREATSRTEGGETASLEVPWTQRLLALGLGALTIIGGLATLLGLG